MPVLAFLEVSVLARALPGCAACTNCIGDAGLPPTPSCHRSAAREGLSKRKRALCLFSAKCLLPSVYLGAFAEPAGMKAV